MKESTFQAFAEWLLEQLQSMRNVRIMRHPVTGFVLVLWLTILSSSAVYAQNKTACELLDRANVESVLGVRLPYSQESLSGGIAFKGEYGNRFVSNT